MTNDPAVPKIRAWLVLHSGAQTGTQYLVGEGTTRLGRSPENDIVIRGPDAASVSLQHLEIRRTATGFSVHDLGSTN